LRISGRSYVYRIHINDFQTAKRFYILVRQERQLCALDMRALHFFEVFLGVPFLVCHIFNKTQASTSTLKKSGYPLQVLALVVLSINLFWAAGFTLLSLTQKEFSLQNTSRNIGPDASGPNLMSHVSNLMSQISCLMSQI
jgi:hypothetical protein